MRTSEQVGPFAPVRMGDQAIDNRIERAETWRGWACAPVRGWLHTRLAQWEDRGLAPVATQMFIADARPRERIRRAVPWLREGARGSPEWLGGQSSAVCELRLSPWVRVPWWRNARAHGRNLVWTLVEQLPAGYAATLGPRGCERRVV